MVMFYISFLIFLFPLAELFNWWLAKPSALQSFTSFNWNTCYDCSELQLVLLSANLLCVSLYIEQPFFLLIINMKKKKKSLFLWKLHLLSLACFVHYHVDNRQNAFPKGKGRVFSCLLFSGYYWSRVHLSVWVYRVFGLEYMF